MSDLKPQADESWAGISQEHLPRMREGDQEAFLRFRKACVGVALHHAHLKPRALSAAWTLEDAIVDLVLYGLAEYLPGDPHATPISLRNAIYKHANATFKRESDRNRRREPLDQDEDVASNEDSVSVLANQLEAQEWRILLRRVAFHNTLSRLNKSQRIGILTFLMGRMKPAIGKSRSPLPGAHLIRAYRKALLAAITDLLIAEGTSWPETQRLRQLRGILSDRAGRKGDRYFANLLLELARLWSPPDADLLVGPERVDP